MKVGQPEGYVLDGLGALTREFVIHGIMRRYITDLALDTVMMSGPWLRLTNR